jgi:hypothetical protein
MSTIALIYDLSGTVSTPKKNISRCGQCNKKLGVLGVKCRCGTEFCISHLQCEMHNCTYDIHKYEIEILKKSLVTGKLKEKLEHI